MAITIQLQPPLNPLCLKHHDPNRSLKKSALYGLGGIISGIVASLFAIIALETFKTGIVSSLTFVGIIIGVPLLISSFVFGIFSIISISISIYSMKKCVKYLER